MKNLQEIKRKYANANQVKCLLDGKIYEIEVDSICNDFEIDLNVWANSKCGQDVKIYDVNKNQFAKIISFNYASDEVVESVVNQFVSRSEVGLKKYNTSLQKNNLSTLEWINHAQQEAMDFVLYLEKLKSNYNN